MDQVKIDSRFFNERQEAEAWAKKEKSKSLIVVGWDVIRRSDLKPMKWEAILYGRF